MTIYKNNSIQTVQMTWIFLALFTIIGCETIVEVDLPEHEPVLVANSLFSPDRLWEVKLNKSKNSLDRESNRAITNATIEIFDGENLVASLTHVDDGIYRSTANETPNIGSTYTLQASAPGFDPIVASDYVPEPVQISSVQTDINSYPFKVTVRFSDPPNEKNYYQVLVISEDTNGSGELHPVWFESDDLLFQDLGGVDPGDALFDDSLISGKNYSLILKTYPHQVEPMAKMYVMLLSVSESYYNYMKSTKFQEDHGENPFSTPIQVYNNIENGLGVFAGYAVSMFPAFGQ